MKLIQNNPYRIIGLLVGATAREQDRQIKRLKQYIEAEQEPQEDFSFPILGNLTRTLECIEDAASKLNLDSDKINAALFWFWNGNPITDEAAFDALKDGDTDTAIEIWQKLTEDAEEVTKRNASAFHNLSTLYLSEYDIDKDTLQLKLRFLESDFVKDFKAQATDETFKITKKELQRLFLENLSQDDNFDISEFFEAITDIDFSAKQDFMKGFVQKSIEQIEQKIETAKNKRKAHKANADRTGQELFTSTANDLTQLKSIVGASDIKFSSISDKVANEILQCSIDYFNDSQEKDRSSNYAKTAMKLAKQAKTLAIGNLTKDRVKDSINTLAEMKDRELSQANMFLKSVKEAYAENERQIRQEVKKMEEADFQIRLGYRSINWSAVEDNIKNSINWGNVNNLLTEILTDKNLKKIKECDKLNEKNEFWELINWIENNSLKSSVITRLIEKYKSIPPKLCFEILSAEVTNTNNKPFYVEEIRYVGLKLKVNSNGNQKVNIYKKYINPEGKYSHSSKSSPEGYTTSESITITPSTQIIDLGGWGNEKECTYMVGEHKIEIYVEHYKVFTKSFQVEWSPNKKAELQRNLELLKNELREIKEFKWLRSSETKQREVKGVQDKIKKAEQTLKNK